MKLVKAILKSIGFIWAGSIIGSLYWNDRFFTLAFNPLQGIYTYGTYYGGDGYIYLIWLQGIVGGSIFGFVVYLLWQNYKLKGMVLPAILITTVFIHHVVTLKLDFWPRKEFYHAAKDGDKETLSRLISRKESWIYYESWGDPVKQENSKDIPLITLIKNNHIDLALKFLEMGGNPNEYNSFDRARALNYAIKKLYFIDNQEAKETNQDPMILRLIHKLIDAGADIDFKSKLAKKPILVEAIINNDRQLVKVLLEARANPNLYYTSLFEVYKIKNQYVMGKRTKSICQLVAEQGEPEIYSLVVEKNCLNTENDLLSIYRSAFIRKKIPHLEESEIINLLESTKNNQSKFLGEVYLPAIDNNYDRVIDWLLAKSIKPLGANKEGYDAILLAIERKKYDLARKLIDWTDHLDQVTFVEEKTAAILAIEHRRLDILEEILERNFEVQTKGPINAWSNRKNIRRKVNLFRLAVEVGDVNAIKMLMSYNIKRDDSLERLLSNALADNQLDVAWYFMDLGAQINCNHLSYLPAPQKPSIPAILDDDRNNGDLYEGQVAIMKRMIKSGLNPDCGSPTLLIRLVKYYPKHILLFKALLDEGADPNVSMSYQQKGLTVTETTLSLAIKKERLEMAELLRSLDAKISESDF